MDNHREFLEDAFYRKGESPTKVTVEVMDKETITFIPHFYEKTGEPAGLNDKKWSSDVHIGYGLINTSEVFLNNEELIGVISTCPSLISNLVVEYV